jgi:hypothetical protein
VQPDGLGKFKNSPHRESNPRPSGLWHSALTTTLPRTPPYDILEQKIPNYSHINPSYQKLGFIKTKVKCCIFAKYSPTDYDEIWYACLHQFLFLLCLLLSKLRRLKNPVCSFVPKLWSTHFKMPFLSTELKSCLKLSHSEILEYIQNNVIKVNYIILYSPILYRAIPDNFRILRHVQNVDVKCV